MTISTEIIYFLSSHTQFIINEYIWHCMLLWEKGKETKEILFLKDKQFYSCFQRIHGFQLIETEKGKIVTMSQLKEATVGNH